MTEIFNLFLTIEQSSRWRKVIHTVCFMIYCRNSCYSSDFYLKLRLLSAFHTLKTQIKNGINQFKRTNNTHFFERLIISNIFCKRFLSWIWHVLSLVAEKKLAALTKNQLIELRCFIRSPKACEWNISRCRCFTGTDKEEIRMGRSEKNDEQSNCFIFTNIIHRW